jgi:predicted nuclease of predicted toxin-antitoxin system
MTPLAFLFDRCFPHRLARMIEEYERDRLVVRHQDDDSRFQIDTSDVEIIQLLSADDAFRWVLVTADTRITRRPAERAVLHGSTIKFFYFGRAWFKMSTHEKMWKFICEWPRIVEIADTQRNRIFEIEGANLKIAPADS